MTLAKALKEQETSVSKAGLIVRSERKDVDGTDADLKKEQNLL